MQTDWHVQKHIFKRVYFQVKVMWLLATRSCVANFIHLYLKTIESKLSFGVIP